MNINLASILQGSMKILNVVNKTLPLVKEFNPTFSKVISKMKKTNPTTNNNFIIPKKVLSTNNNNQKKIINSSTLTFFQ